MRKTKNLKLKIEEATRLGYKKIMVPKITTDLIGNSNTLIELIEVESIKEAMYIALN